VGTDTLMQSVLMELLDTFDVNKVPFASVLLFELYKAEQMEGGYYVRVIYNKELNYTVPLGELLEKIKQVTVPEREFRSRCLGEYTLPVYTVDWKLFGLTWIAVVSGFALLLAVAVSIIKKFRRKVLEENLHLTQPPPI
jgi:hypothetical protein